MTAFSGIARDYDDLWLLTDGYRDWMLAKTLGHLRMRKNSKFADLGGGTGMFAHLLKLGVPLDSDAICVDPSDAMLLNAGQYRGLQTYCESAETFAQRQVPLDRILIKESIHHVRNRQSFWKKISSSLRPDGRVLVVTRPSLPELPLFKRGMTAFSESQPELDILLEEIAASSLSSVTNTEAYYVEMPKERWYAMLRARFMSSLAGFTSGEIEQGILEIDGQLDGNQIRFTDHLFFVVIEHESK
ncbi:class I SAM-dependent methyltransferase [Marinobacter sp.]|uniref:class I SAM-dependent methyltransferase n=1 Tax=Marinobacter sp. TaxID=50741 RepID=UPI0026252316|nr:class I SAM-dependent methyltransferase [Marinobacter sp.]